MKIIEDTPIEIQEAMSNILDVFGGGDGGGDFYSLCLLINGISQSLNDKSQKESSQKLLNIIIQFNNLIKVAQNEIKGRNEVS